MSMDVNIETMWRIKLNKLPTNFAPIKWMHLLREVPTNW